MGYVVGGGPVGAGALQCACSMTTITRSSQSHEVLFSQFRGSVMPCSQVMSCVCEYRIAEKSGTIFLSML